MSYQACSTCKAVRAAMAALSIYAIVLSTVARPVAMVVAKPVRHGISVWALLLAVAAGGVLGWLIMWIARPSVSTTPGPEDVDRQ